MSVHLPANSPVVVGREPLTIDDVLDVARGERALVVSDDAVFRGRLSRTADALERRISEGAVVYGVTTGFGGSCKFSVSGELIQQLPVNLVRFHGAGTGRLFGDVETAAVLVARIASLATGFSAVRPELLDRLAALTSSGVRPCIPQEGSVGASGDLTPLSYVAAVLMGERRARFRGEELPAKEALERAGLGPIALGPKESLALMNGTAVMSGLACIAVERARRVARWASTLTATASDVTRGQAAHFDARIFRAKPHPGQELAARWIREHLESSPDAQIAGVRVQDRYSLRCAPHVIGVLLEALAFSEPIVEREVNGAADNPLVDPDTFDVLHGGNFYGGHMCMVADLLKPSVANVADLLERQLVLLCHPDTSGGLPLNLVGSSPEVAVAHHGFKAMQITASALTAEAAKLTMPASVFSRSTENHNQDKVSMGTIAVRDCLRILELTETVATIHTLALAQAAELRGGNALRVKTRELVDVVRNFAEPHRFDRPMDGDIEAVLDAVRAGRFDGLL